MPSRFISLPQVIVGGRNDGPTLAVPVRNTRRVSGIKRLLGDFIGDVRV